MATTYKTSLNGQKVIVHENANATVVIVGNNTVSNVTSNTSEIVYNAAISKVWYGSDAGAWLVGRGNSTANGIVGVFGGTGVIDFAEDGTLLNIRADGTNMYLTLAGTANGYIMVELRKNSI